MDLSPDYVGLRILLFCQFYPIMVPKDAEEIIDKTGDEGSLEEKVVELVGKEIKIIADAGFDEFNEEVRLNAKKVLDVKL